MTEKPPALVDSDDELSCSPDCTLQSPSPSECPDGGLRAWTVAFGAWCGMMPSMGLLNSMGVLQTFVTEHQLNEYTETDIGWIFGVFTFFVYFGGIQIGTSLPFPQPYLTVC